MRLTYKFLLIFILVGMFILLVSFITSYTEVKHSLTKSTFETLTAARESKKREIEAYFERVRQQIITQSANLMTIKATRDFTNAFAEQVRLPVTPKEREKLSRFYQQALLPYSKNYAVKPVDLLPADTITQRLQHDYIANNKFAAGKKRELVTTNNQSQYDRYHTWYHPVFRQFLELNGYYDFFIFDNQADMVYSVVKEIDFATNLLTGPYRESGLGKAVQRALGFEKPGMTALIDFEPYLPSFGKPAAFIASPIFEGNKRVGVLVFQLPISRIGTVMTSEKNWKNEGYGNTGESYIVASDYGMRNDSRRLIEAPERYIEELKQAGVEASLIDNIRSFGTSVFFRKIETDATRSALKGETATRIITDQRGVELLSSFTRLNIAGLNWVIIAEIEIDEALAGLYRIESNYIYIAVIISIVVILLAILVVNRMVRPLKSLVELTENISKTNFSKRLPVDSKDEIGDLASAFNRMSSSLEVTSVSRQYIDKIIESMGEALFVLKANSGNPDELRIQTVNQATLDMLGVEPVEIIYRKLCDFMEQDENFTSEEVEALLSVDSLPVTDKVLISKSGRPISVLFSVTVMRDQNSLEDSLLCVCIAKDITERKQVEEKLKLSSTVFNNAVEPVIIADAEGCIVDVNPAFEYAMGYDRHELSMMSISDFRSAGEKENLAMIIQKTKVSENWRGEISLLNMHDESMHFMLSCSAVTNNDGVVTNYVFILSDIGDLKDREQRILNIANHDALTGLPNRMLFNDRLSQSVAACKRHTKNLAVLFLDLDGFKAVNDTYGHQAGDELLIQVAARLKDELRDTDTVARVGGDEFIVILSVVENSDSCVIVADKLLDAIHEPYELSTANASVSSSIGIACYPEHAQDPDRLVKAADSAMYEAKNAGKNTIRVFSRE